MRFIALLFAIAAAGCSSSVEGLDEGTAEYPAPPAVVVEPLAGCWYSAGHPRPDGDACITEDKPHRWGVCETIQGLDAGTKLHVCKAL